MKKIYIILLVSFFQFAAPQISQADSSCNIGILLYEKGEFSKAFNHMKRLSAYSNPCAEYYLGLMYFKGEGTAKNIKLAYKYIDKAIKGKYPSAIGFYDRQE